MKRKSASRVGPHWAGSTVLDYLCGRFTYLDRQEWEGQFREGRLSVNGEAAQDWTVLESEDLVAFDSTLFPEPEADASIAIVAETEDFLIVNKSGSLPCHPGGRFFKRSLWFILRESHGEVRIATRLDRETSGLVLVCKTADSARFAQGLLSSGNLEKSYIAMVHGLFPENLVAQGWLIPDPDSEVRKKRSFVQNWELSGGTEGQTCSTSFERLKIVKAEGGPISILLAHPQTGRTHQIRATLFSLGFPVVGDKLYGLDEGFFLKLAAGGLEAADFAALLLPSQALHCSALSFAGPRGLPVSASSMPRWGRPYDEILAQLPVLR